MKMSTDTFADICARLAMKTDFSAVGVYNGCVWETAVTGLCDAVWALTAWPSPPLLKCCRQWR